MLKKLELNDFEKYVDRAYEIALDRTRSSYPAYSDGIKTKEDFITFAKRAFDSDEQEILLYIRENEVCGWIHYEALKDDKYIGFHSFNIEKDTYGAWKEFEDYCRERYKGYDLYAGFPAENKEAINYFKENGFELLEKSYPHVFHFKNFSPKISCEYIRKIDKLSFAEFEKLHSQNDDDMYWNCERIYEAFDRWHIFIYEDGNAKATVYFTGMSNLPEIFGVDFANAKFDCKAFKELITACLNEVYRLGGKNLYHFSDERETKILSELGFENIGIYNCFMKKI